MALPDLIEIVPLDRPVRAEITVPGSKSITNRGLILAALAEGEVALKGALWSEDTEIMAESLQELGFMVNVTPDPSEACNRTITVFGKGGELPPGGTAARPLELFVGNSGTAARFLSAFVCLGKGVYRLHGTPRMHERPQAALFEALRELGYRVSAEQGNERLPVVIEGVGRSEAGTRSCRVSIVESSQFASALLLCAREGGWRVKVEGDNAEESPYVAMTQRMIEAFPQGGGPFQIEPDASSGSYFWAAGWLVYVLELISRARRAGDWSGSPVYVKAWPDSGWQIDADFPDFLPLPMRISRGHQLGDSIMTAMVLAADRDAARGWGWTDTPKSLEFADLGRLRVQETERVAALRTELTRCGAKVIESGDTLTVFPSELHGAAIETYEDHRMAMCFAILGLKVPGIRIKNPACVKKTFPNFFQKLAAPPPGGLGAVLLDAQKGRRLAESDLVPE